MASDLMQLSPLMQQAIAASQANDSQTALNLFTQACREEQSSAWPHFLLGAELAQLGRIAEAETAYANAVIMAPDFRIARFELGTLQFTSGRPSIAVVTWHPLLDLPDDNALKLFVQGYVELAQDAFDNALQYFARGMQANTENPPLNGNIQLLVTEIEKLRHSPSPVSAPAPDEVPPESTDNHFLLSAYNKGSLH
ncbi:tetratricopeptide repeat protein [Herbaspirillum autotrophicum]|uniref:tetratricopeptide repeat protein n=1 Tax=Herbaspirillum autotrophicum TaxID=180195 RepID=UPI0012EDB2B2|nr:tetratricopeptide repeat protein [Herbaspirillum autotrophicum]